LLSKIKQYKRALIYLAIVVLVTVLAATIIEYLVMKSPTILPGVYTGQVNLSRMTLEQAEQELIPIYQHALERQIMIHGGGKQWSFSPEQLGVQADLEKTLRQAWETGRQGALWEKWYVRWNIKKNTCRIPLFFQVDEKRLINTVQEMAQMIDVEPKNAGIIIKDNHETAIVPGENGLKVRIEDSVAALREVLQSEEKSRCDLMIQVEKPQITDQDVASWEINGVVASFETFFDPAKKDRSENIKMAASALDHVLVMPQEIFSFNKVVGPRTSEAGYKESLVIENNQFTPGIGGGVCQVSTTLYNAILLANLPIVERHPHSLPITYVSPGLDATVSYNWADLSFLNDRQKPVLLHSEYRPGKLKIMIFGTVEEFPQVKLTSKIVKYLEAEKEIIKDPSLAPGQTVVVEKGQRGMIVEVYREFISDGHTISRELISRDKYKPQKAVIRVSALSQPES
jgi:vancomycin resistance protein YoaR